MANTIATIAEPKGMAVSSVLAQFECLHSGFGASFQDFGRNGYRHLGVPISGAADKLSMACANALVGNANEDCVIEISMQGPQLLLTQATAQVALVGDMEAFVLFPNGHKQRLPSWRTATLEAGQTLLCTKVNSGLAYLAVAGGWNALCTLGSHSYYGRAELGQGLRSGQTYGVNVKAQLPDSKLTQTKIAERSAPPFEFDSAALRCVAGPQEDYFDAESIDSFYSQEWKLSMQLDRMGYRLDGTPLLHNALGAEIASDGVCVGAVQVPPNGIPIVLMADGQTIGGYPKIASVITADIGRLANMRANTSGASVASVRFAKVSLPEAHAILRAQMAAFEDWKNSIKPVRDLGDFDSETLLAHNLIGGILRGDE
ncbi:MAG: biotin-dependent carboxyltransferase family protein [Polaromonas sp.]|nr:biotin-dependent carboxyltransferase family protein [Polaromonas sp.]